MTTPQDPQQPGQQPQPGPAYGYPHPYQQPQQGAPVWGHPAGFTPNVQPPKKKTGRNIGIGCLGAIGVIVVIGIIAAVASSGGSDTAAPAPSHSSSTKHGAAAPAKPKKKTAPKTVTFKVWGTAPEHGAGPVTVTYGSDTDSRQGQLKNGSFTGTVPFKSGALEYDVMAVLQGSGDIHCSVTVDGHTKNGHASGGYADCDAMLSNGLFGDWS